MGFHSIFVRRQTVLENVCLNRTGCQPEINDVRVFSPGHKPHDGNLWKPPRSPQSFRVAQTWLASFLLLNCYH
ncbi:unnamed protein product [Boreogadus saida]